jgi:hypothetical protein
VLFAAIGMVVSFFTVNGLGPGTEAVTLDDRITDDKFCIAFDTSSQDETLKEKINNFFSSTGAEEVNTKSI